MLLGRGAWADMAGKRGGRERWRGETVEVDCRALQEEVYSVHRGGEAQGDRRPVTVNRVRRRPGWGSMPPSVDGDAEAHGAWGVDVAQAAAHARTVGGTIFIFV